jgi:ketosteroid isomerase-like protein
MAEETRALVRRVYESWNSDGVRSIEPFLAEGVEVYDAPEMPDARVWQGREAVLARMEDVAASVGGGWADLREFADHGNAVLVNMIWQEDENAGSPAFAEIWHVVRVEDDRISSIRVFLDQATAEADAA